MAEIPNNDDGVIADVLGSLAGYPDNEIDEDEGEHDPEDILFSRDWSNFEVFRPPTGRDSGLLGMMKLERISAILRRKEEELLLENVATTDDNEGLTTFEKKLKVKQKQIEEEERSRGEMEMVAQNPQAARLNAINLLARRAQKKDDESHTSDSPSVTSNAAATRVAALGVLANRIRGAPAADVSGTPAEIAETASPPSDDVIPIESQRTSNHPRADNAVALNSDSYGALSLPRNMGSLDPQKSLLAPSDLSNDRWRSLPRAVSGGELQTSNFPTRGSSLESSPSSQDMEKKANRARIPGNDSDTESFVNAVEKGRWERHDEHGASLPQTKDGISPLDTNLSSAPNLRPSPLLVQQVQIAVTPRTSSRAISPALSPSNLQGSLARPAVVSQSPQITAAAPQVGPSRPPPLQVGNDVKISQNTVPAAEVSPNQQTTLSRGNRAQPVITLTTISPASPSGKQHNDRRNNILQNLALALPFGSAIRGKKQNDPSAISRIPPSPIPDAAKSASTDELPSSVDVDKKSRQRHRRSTSASDIFEARGVSRYQLSDSDALGHTSKNVQDYLDVTVPQGPGRSRSQSPNPSQRHISPTQASDPAKAVSNIGPFVPERSTSRFASASIGQNKSPTQSSSVAEIQWRPSGSMTLGRIGPSSVFSRPEIESQTVRALRPSPIDLIPSLSRDQVKKRKKYGEDGWPKLMKYRVDDESRARAGNPISNHKAAINEGGCLHHGHAYQVLTTSSVKDRYLFLFKEALIVAKEIRAESRSPPGSRFEVKSVLALSNATLAVNDPSESQLIKELGETNHRIPNSPEEAAAAPIHPTTVAIAKFSTHPIKAVCQLIAKRILPCTPQAIAHFLHSTPGLSRRQIGKFIGRPEHSDILAAYVGAFTFKYMRIDTALRLFLGAFRLPSGIDAVDAILDAFARRWSDCNKGAFGLIDDDKSRFIALRLVFAIMALNAQTHGSYSARDSFITDSSESAENDIINRASGAGGEASEFLESFLSSLRSELVDVDDSTGFTDMLLDVHRSITTEKLEMADSGGGINVAAKFERSNWIMRVIGDQSTGSGEISFPLTATLNEPTQAISITVPNAVPGLAVRVHGVDLLAEPQLLDFSHSSTATFRIIVFGAPGRKLVMFTRVRAAGTIEAEERQDGWEGCRLHAPFITSRVLRAEPSFMKHKFQISVWENLQSASSGGLEAGVGVVKGRYLFAVGDSTEMETWISQLKRCVPDAAESIKVTGSSDIFGTVPRKKIKSAATIRGGREFAPPFELLSSSDDSDDDRNGSEGVIEKGRRRLANQRPPSDVILSSERGVALKEMIMRQADAWGAIPANDLVRRLKEIM